MDQQAKQQNPEPVDSRSNESTVKKIVSGLLVVTLLAAACFGVWYWQQQEIDRLNDRIEQLEEAQASADKNADNAEAIPEDWTEYRNESLGFGFAYPEEWGEVQLVEADRSYEGQHYFLSFSDYDQFKLAAKSTDYNYTGPGMGAPPVNGFKDFDERYESIIKHEQDRESSSGEIFEKTDNSVVYSSFLWGNVMVKGIVRLDELAGMEFAYTKPSTEEYFTDVELEELAEIWNNENSNSISNYLEEDEIELVKTFARYVKPL